ncbi:hypothetical protein [Paenibacillus sp. S150]|uniref:hypothetical protein n=1 Tax=Paenibacillus sp. S150 TaxID=2749826 RepID=UPI001C57E89D|nr:hypothetical protein [Paenibacillus sp. S150]MBW4081290.1 hypothetical protein [Paenibacillus sp. S150]
MSNEEEPKLYADFDPVKMERFVKRDALLRFVVEDFVKKGLPRVEALEVTFNGYVLEDSGMIREYEKG